MLGLRHWLRAKGTGIDCANGGTARHRNRDHGSVDCQIIRRGFVELGRNNALTPTQATLVPALFRKGTMCLPFVTVLSRLGLNASPEKKVRGVGCPSKLGCDR
jgi:hypothetical protein